MEPGAKNRNCFNALIGLILTAVFLTMSILLYQIVSESRLDRTSKIKLILIAVFLLSTAIGFLSFSLNNLYTYWKLSIDDIRKEAILIIADRMEESEEFESFSTE